MRNPRLLAYLLLTVVAVCWAGNAIFARLAVGEISPMLLVTLRWLAVVLMVLAIAQRSVRQDWPVLRQHLWLLGGLGALGFTAFNTLFYIAAHSTTAINIGIVQGAIPVFVLLGMFTFFGERVRPVQLAGVGLTLAGVAVVVSGGSLERLVHLALNFGDVLALCACALYAGYTVWLRLRPDVAPLAQFSVMAVAALLTSLPPLVFEWVQGDVLWPGTLGWSLVAAIALFPSLVAQVLFIRGVELIGAGRAGVFVNLVPVLAAIFAVLFLRETFALYHALALGLVLGGIALSELAKPAA